MGAWAREGENGGGGGRKKFNVRVDRGWRECEGPQEGLLK